MTSRRFVPGLLVASFAALAGCGGSSSTGGAGKGGGAAGAGGGAIAGAGGGVPLAPQARLEISPAGLLLEPGGAAWLQARAVDDAGAPMAVTVTWHATGNAVTLAPMGGDRVSITAGTATGSAQLVARAGALESSPVTVAIARLVPGGRLVRDEDVMTDPLPVDGQQPGGPGTRLHAVVAGAAPTAGTILVASGKPLAGKVVSSTAAPGGNDVVLEVVPLDQVFAELRIAQSYDAGKLPVLTPTVAPTSTVANADGSITRTFGLDIPAETRAYDPESPDDLGGETREIPPLASGSFRLGPFYCGAEATAKPTFSASQMTAAITPHLTSLDLDLQVGVGTTSMKVLATGHVEAHVTGPLRLNGQLEGSVGCQAPLIQLFAPVPPPVALIAWPALVLGARFSTTGTIEVNAMELVVDAEVKQPMKLGFELTPGGTFNHLSELDPGMPKIDVELRNTTANSPARLRVDIRGGLYAEAALTNIPYLAIQTLRDKYPFLQMLELESGLQALVQVGTIADQVNDPAYVAGYNINFLLKLGLGGDLKKAFGWLSNLLTALSPVSPELKYEQRLYSSPFGGALTYLAKYRQGERVGFRVVLDPKHVAPDLLGYYNVKRIEIWRKDAQGGAKLLAGRNVVNGETDIELGWTADVNGAIDDKEVVAFVEPVMGEGFSFKLAGVQGWTGIRQLGSTHDQIGRAIDADAKGRVAVVGYDLDQFVGIPSAGGVDAAWIQLNPIGGLPFATLSGGTGDDVPVDIVRSADGYYYVAGRSLYGDFGGVGPAYPSFYAWLQKLDSEGHKVWSRQWVTPGYANEIAHSVAIGPGGAVFVGGTASSPTIGGTAISPICSPTYELEQFHDKDCGDVAVTAFDPAGNTLWHTVDARMAWQIRGNVTVDPATGDVVLAGTSWSNIETEEVPGNHDSTKTPLEAGYPKNGIGIWVFSGADGAVVSRKFFKVDDVNLFAQDLAADTNGNFYLVGNSEGPFPGGTFFGGTSDGFLMKLNALELQPGSGGGQVSSFGTSGQDLGIGVKTVPNGDVYITGSTGGELFGAFAGGLDAFVVRVEGATGTPLWSAQFGSAGADIGTDVAVDPYGNVFVCGETDGKLGSNVTANQGGRDQFVAKLGPSGLLQ